MGNNAPFSSLILCAGFGNRLRPITSSLPKPLIPVFGAALVDVALYQISRLNPKVVAANAHYLGEKIHQHFSATPSISVRVLDESPQILGTGGCIPPFLPYFDTDDLLIYNGDILSNFDLSKLLATHQRSANLATLGLLPTPLPGENAVYVNADTVCGIGPLENMPSGCTAHGFAGVHILRRELAVQLPTSGEFSIIPHYQRIIAEGRKIGAFIHDGLWFDLGTIPRYWQCHVSLLKMWHAGRNDLQDIFAQANPGFADGLKIGEFGSYFLSPLAKLSDSIELTDFSVVHGECDITGKCQISESMVFPGWAKHLAEDLRSKIVSPDFSVSLGH